MAKRYQRSGVKIHSHLDKQVTAIANAVVEMLEGRWLLAGTPEVSVELAGAVGGAIYASEVIGNTAYTATGNQFRVLDVSTPSNPVCISHVLLAGTAMSLAVSGSYAYVADGTAGLQIIDISDPAAPTLAGSYDTPGEALGVAVSGSYAYLANIVYGLRVIDISNPAAPTEVARFNRADAYDVTISGSYAYVAAGSSGLLIADISNPAAPSFESGCLIDGWGADARGVSISGSYAYVADDRAGLAVIDISDPYAPNITRSFAMAGAARDVVISGSYGYVASDDAGLQIVNVSDPWNVTVVGSYDTTGYARGVSISGSYAYVADYGYGLTLIDISNPAAPTLVGSYTAPGEAWKASVAGSYAYVASGDSGLQLIDISDPSAPVPTGSYNTCSYNAMGSAGDVSVVGSYAYVAAGAAGLQIIDISNPSAPTLAGSNGAEGWAQGVSVSGAYAYVADASFGLQIFDISDPAAPTLVGSYLSPGDVSDVSVSGSYAYIVNATGLRVLDITNPAIPTLVGSYAMDDWVVSVNISGSYAYVTSESSGLQIFDISDPAAPTLAGSYVTLSWATDVTTSGVYAYVTTENSGLHIINISDPSAPTLAGSFATAGYACGVVVSGSYAYVADAISGLQILRLNTAPSDISVSSTSIAENEPTGAVVGTLSATDAIPEDTFTYALVSGAGSADNAWFQIVGNQLTTSARFDHEACSCYSIRICTTDTGGRSYEKPIAITVADDPTDLRGQFGLINGKAVKSPPLQDANGDLVTITLTGGGSGKVYGDGNTFECLILTGTSDKSNLTISVRKNKHGGDGQVTIGNITSDGLLKGINASAAILSGQVLINSLNQTPGKSSGSLKFRQISDADITVQAMRVASILVAGSISDSRIVTTNSIGTIKAAALLDSNILVGVATDFTGTFAGPADFANPAARLDSLRVTGQKLPKDSSYPAYVMNSHISAPTVGTVSLANVLASSGPIVHVMTDTGVLKVSQTKLVDEEMAASGIWKKAGERPAIWEAVG